MSFEHLLQQCIVKVQLFSFIDLSSIFSAKKRKRRVKKKRGGATIEEDGKPKEAKKAKAKGEIR